jgi:uncharacterized protein (DUF934 family)
MPRLIKNGAVVDDRWTLLSEAYSLSDVPDEGAVIVPLVLWLAERRELRARGDVGVLLAPDEDPSTLADDAATLPVIAVDFPQFTDGRGYSIARLLRERYRFHGELRAVGDVLRDQLYLMAECGFDAFAVREDRDPQAALTGLRDFDGLYAPTARTPQPWFRRRAAAVAAAGGDSWYPDI